MSTVARVEHVMERMVQVKGSGNGGSIVFHTSSHRDERRKDKTASTQEDKASESWADNFFHELYPPYEPSVLECKKD